MFAACLLFSFKRNVAGNSWVLLDKSISAIPFSQSRVVSEKLPYCGRSYFQTSRCVWEVSGLPRDAEWDMAGCSPACALFPSCHYLSRGGECTSITVLLAAPFRSPLLLQRWHPHRCVVYWSCLSLCVNSKNPWWWKALWVRAVGLFHLPDVRFTVQNFLWLVMKWMQVALRL